MMRLLLILAVMFPAALVAQDEAPPAPEDVAMDVCALCHDVEAEAVAASVHGQLMARRSEETLQGSCAGCHNPSALHVEEATPETVQRVPTSETCATCHTEAPGSLRLATPGHPRHGVECGECHASGHEDVHEAEPLLAARSPELCGGCHAEQRSAFELPFAHRHGSRAFDCEECHQVHAGGGETRRLTLLGNGGACITCHTETAGPFIFPHAPREVDGCIECHEPHGSPNPRQLVRRTVLSLCLECHIDLPPRSFHDFTRPRNRACQTCHRAVHGSNSDHRLLEE